jgi:hypothetical protein
MRSTTLAALLLASFLAGCGPELSWNCDIGDQRCNDGVSQVCLLDHADTAPDGTLTDYVGKWMDRGACR